jgi:hypothetical protein
MPRDTRSPASRRVTPRQVSSASTSKTPRAQPARSTSGYDWRFPSVFDPEGRIAYELGLQGTPTTIFLDTDHREVARIVGETDEAGLLNGLKRATADA